MKIVSALFVALFVLSAKAQTNYSLTYELKLSDETTNESEINTVEILRKNTAYSITKKDEIFEERIVLDEQQKKAVEFVYSLEDENKEAVISLFEASYIDEIEPYVDFLELFTTEAIPNDLLKLTAETKTIQGIVCKKVILYDEIDENVIGFGYLAENKHFVVFDGGEFFNCNLGALLELELNTSEFKLTAKCTSLSLTAPAASNFDMAIPEDYELLEFDEEEIEVEGDEGE